MEDQVPKMELLGHSKVLRFDGLRLFCRAVLRLLRAHSDRTSEFTRTINSDVAAIRHGRKLHLVLPEARQTATEHGHSSRLKGSVSQAGTTPEPVEKPARPGLGRMHDQ